MPKSHNNTSYLLILNQIRVCGQTLVVAHLVKHIATYQIHDTFKITERGIVFAGIILDGDFMTGDFIRFNFKGQLLERKIKGIDAGMRATEGKPNVGVMIESLNDQEIDELRNWNPNLTVGEIYSKK